MKTSSSLPVGSYPLQRWRIQNGIIAFCTPWMLIPEKNMKKSSLKSSWKPSLTCSPLGLSLPSCKKAKCLGVSGFSGLSAFPFVSRLDTMGPTMDIWPKKAAGVWVSGTSFLWSQLIFASVPCWNESWEANLFLVCCLLWAKTRCSKFFFEQIPNKILTTQIGSCSTKNLKRPENIRKPSTQKLQCPKKWIHVSGHKIKAQGPPFGESPAWNWNQACRATKSSTSHPCFWAWHRRTMERWKLTIVCLPSFAVLDRIIFGSFFDFV